jgi:hypothetical protein
MSHTKVFENRALEPLGFRARFASHWARYLRSAYRNPEEVAVAFGVRFQTASNWWHGLNRPSGDVVALELLRNPDAAATMRGMCG